MRLDYKEFWKGKSSAFYPIATMRIEEIMIESKMEYTFLIVTHKMSIFTSPKDERTDGHITGRFA
jgi:hypothetical protein